MSSPSRITSPRLIPILKRRRKSGGSTATSTATAPLIYTAHVTASVTLGNSISMPSPVSCGHSCAEIGPAAMAVTLTPVLDIPMVRPGDDLAGLLIAACERKRSDRYARRFLGQ